MRKLTTSVLFLLFFAVNSFAQDTRLKDEQIKAKKEPQGSVFVAENWDKLVPLAQKYYSRRQAAILEEYKIKQTNFLYSKSFTITTSGCNINENDLDFNSLSQKRKVDARNTVHITQQGCSAEIELLSINEVNTALDKIKREN